MIKDVWSGIMEKEESASPSEASSSGRASRRLGTSFPLLRKKSKINDYVSGGPGGGERRPKGEEGGGHARVTTLGY